MILVKLVPLSVSTDETIFKLILVNRSKKKCIIFVKLVLLNISSDETINIEKSFYRSKKNSG